MTTARFTAARCPVNDDKAETHYHKQETDPSETGGLKEKHRVQGRDTPTGGLSGCMISKTLTFTGHDC